MRLIEKLTLALVAGTSAILAVNGYFRVEREVAIFQADRVRDHDLIGRSLGAAVSAVWRADGEARALAAVSATNARAGKIRVRWVAAEPGELARIPGGETETRIARDEKGEARRITYAPVDVDGVRRGALELSESLDSERRYVRSTVVDTVATTLALAVVSGAVAMVLGALVVGRPVRALAAKARRIGRGDFAEPLHLRGNDELAELAGEMNAMCDRLVATLEQLRHADRLTTVGKLASGIAHELGTPLNVVSARAAMIASGEAAGEEAVESARAITTSAERMTAIIRQLLEFARRRSSKKALRDLRALASETVDLLRPLADKKSVALDVTGGDATCEVDAGQLQQAMTNLVINAIHASRRGGRVELALDRAGGEREEWIRLRVRDDGTGIEPANLPHVFEPFFTTKGVGEGTGLGLSVTYGIVREHGGWIEVESAPGRGSVFTVFLPRAVG